MHKEDKSKRDYSELPPMSETPRDVKDIADIAIPVDEFYVTEWSEHKKSPPSQVHIVISLEELESSVAIALRLKSKRATSELIKALQRHRDLVWP